MLNQGAVALEAWLSENAIKATSLADDIGAHRSYISLLRTGRRCPTLKFALALGDRCGIDPRVWRLPVKATKKGAVRRAR
jgi:plasmid maintenance system antidote protein VapI